MIEQSFIQDLLARIDIVDVVARHLPLKKAGANFTACCPFHNEKTPSFTVSPSKQFYHCFGCGRHGNAINFLMEHGGMSFVEAVEHIAAHAGVQIPVNTESSSVVATPVSVDKAGATASNAPSASTLHERMEAAAKYYREQLKQSESAIDYLRRRGVSGQTALRFGIGYAPPDWQNLSAVFADYPVNDTGHALVQAGLVVGHEGKKNYDRFRNRIMFPIKGQKGKIVGFGGRVLDGSEPKYLNSPETPLFTKGRELYNLASAGAAIRQSGRVVVVEGYMDVVMLAQHGIENVVATLGTATTSVHVQKLMRYTDEIVFCFDGDEAGKKAAWRALENSLAQLKDGKDIKFLFLPEKEDPDSYVRAHGKSAFEAQIERALPLSLFLCNELSRRVNLGTSEGRARLVQQAGPLLSQITAPVFAYMLMKRLSELAGIEPSQLAVFLKFKHKNLSPAAPPRRPAVSRPLSVTPCRRLIQILLHDAAYVKKIDSSLLAMRAEGDDEMALLAVLIEFLQASPVPVDELTPAMLSAHFDQTPYRTLLDQIVSDTPIQETDWDIEAEFIGGVERLRDVQRKSRMTELHNKPLHLLTPEERKELQRLSVS
ncbi:MAG: DNA primase [Nitrosomonas halophila]